MVSINKNKHKITGGISKESVLINHLKRNEYLGSKFDMMIPRYLE